MPDDNGPPSARRNPSPHISNARAWLTVLILVLFIALACVDRFLVSLMVDPIKAHVGIDDFAMGVLQGPAFALPFLLGSLPMGWIVDRFSKKWALFLGATVWSTATAAFGLMSSFAGLVAMRALMGLGQAVLQPAAWNMIARLFPPTRMSFALSTFTSGAQIGVAASYLLGGGMISWANRHAADPLPIVGQLLPWQLACLAIGLPGIILALLVFATPAEASRPGGTGKAPAHGLSGFVRANLPFLALHFAGFSLLSTMVYGAAAWMPTHLLRTFGLDIRTVGMVMAAMQFPICAGGAIFAGWLVDRAFSRGRHDAHLLHFARAGLFVAAIGGLGFAFSSTAAGVVLCFAVIQFIQPFSGVAGAALQIATPAEYRGRISAAFIMCYNAAGMTLGPSFVVFLGRHATRGDTLGHALALAYALLGLCAAALLWLGRKPLAAAVRRTAPQGRKAGPA